MTSMGKTDHFVVHLVYKEFNGFSSIIVKHHFFYLIYMFWVLKRIISMRHFFSAPQTYIKTDVLEYKIIAIFLSNILLILAYCLVL